MPRPTKSKYLRIKRSSTHGFGAFAARNIPNETEIIKYTGNRVTKKQSDIIAEEEEKACVYLFDLNRRFDINGNVKWNTARFLNHSCDPNCETIGDDDEIWLVAKRDIKKGEELSYDYCFDLDNYENHPCKCSSKNCRGYIIDEKYEKRLKKILTNKKSKRRIKAK